jgi:phosphate starvation-inducible PhoH-like protein
MKYLLLNLCFSYGLKNGNFKNDIVLTTKQQKYHELLKNNNLDLVIAHGIAGTGKTFLACKTAYKKLIENEIDKIILTRPIVSVENENLGFLPGELNDKIKPWLSPLFDTFEKESDKSQLVQLINSGKIELIPLGFMRGRTFDHCIVIADEMQNSTPNQMKMLLTRMGENSKIFVTGDTTQCDLNISTDNGLANIIELLNNMYDLPYEMYENGIGIVKLEDIDIKRSKFVSNVIKIYNSI